MNVLFGGVYVIITLAIVVMLALVLFRNTKNKLNVSFAIFLIAMGAWAILNFVSNQTQLPFNFLLIINHILMAAASGLVVALYYFCVNLLELRNRKTTLIMNSLGIINAFAALTPWVITDITIQDAAVGLEFGVLALPYFLIILLICGFVLGFLIYTLRAHDGIKRQRALVMLSSLSFAILLVTLTNIFIPIISGDFATTVVGPLFLIFILGGTGYAIIKHRLFDIRAIAARSIAYILSIILLVVIYAGFVFGAIGNVFNLSAVNTITQIVYIASAIILAITFQPVKRFFDRLTDRVFYRGEYNSQEVVNTLSNTIANEIRLQKIIQQAFSILAFALKSKNIHIILNTDTGSRTFQLVTTPRKIIDYKYLKHNLEKYPTQIFDVGTEPSKLYRTLSDKNISIILRLETSKELIGYVLFEEKQNGSLYDQKDKKMLSTVGHELGLAIQNALRFEEIQQFNETLQQKVEDATAKLRHSNKRLRELDVIKDEFMSIASHQLRTPLTSVKGYISMVLDGDAGSLKKEQRRLLKEAYASSQRMVYLISDFLNISRIRTGNFVLQPEPIDLAKLVKEEVAQLSPVAKNRELQLDVHVPSQFPTLLLDKDKIRQVVMNFIDNAIFYTPPKGKITVTLLISQKEVRYKVEDTGVGVPEKEQHKLFTKFFRASNASRMRPDGTGVGLFLAKKVIILHGGTLIFKSKIGKGSTFGFSIPLQKIKPNIKEANK